MLSFEPSVSKLLIKVQSYGTFCPANNSNLLAPSKYFSIDLTSMVPIPWFWHLGLTISRPTNTVSISLDALTEPTNSLSLMALRNLHWVIFSYFIRGFQKRPNAVIIVNLCLAHVSLCNWRISSNVFQIGLFNLYQRHCGLVNCLYSWDNYSLIANAHGCCK